MKNRLLITLTALVLAVAPALRAQPPAEPKTELGDKMADLSKAYRGLKKLLPDATKNTESLAQIATIKADFEAALKLKPATTAAKPTAEQAAYVEKFQAEIKATIALFGKLEDAIKAGKNDDAVAITKDIDAQQKKDHTEFRKPAGPK